MNEIWMSRLHAAGWYGREFAYAKSIQRIKFGHNPHSPAAALILNGEYPKQDIWSAIKNMLDFTGFPVQVIGCFHGVHKTVLAPALSINIEIIAADCNAARSKNIAALFADAPVLVFLHSSFMPQPMLINAYIDCLRHKLAARGRIIGQPSHEEVFFNPDPGEDSFPWAFDLEENCAAAKDIFLKMGGFDETMPNGAACLDFSCRLLRYWRDMNQQFYCAEACGTMAPGYVRAEYQTLINALNNNYAGKIGDCGMFWQRNLASRGKESAF